MLVFGIVAAGPQKLSFWLGIAHAGELKAEIAKRAVNSRSQGWNKD